MINNYNISSALQTRSARDEDRIQRELTSTEDELIIIILREKTVFVL